MFEQYLITGATGNLGRELSRALLERGARVRALVLPGDSGEGLLPADVSVCHGDVGDRVSLAGFFAGDLGRACLIHCAGMISIASRRPPHLWRVNVSGMQNIIELCREHGVGRVIYTSSVHAIPEAKGGAVIRECSSFLPDSVKGHYAKSKSAATAIALEAARRGMNLSVVHPSGILCPSDEGWGNISAAISAYCRGKLPLAANGGYDFVDVRDVVDGILSCAERGRSGECYILSGHYATLRDILGYIRQAIHGKPVLYLPLWLVKLISPLCEWISILKKQPLVLTPYSAYTLGSNARFSNEKAAAELGYHPRSLSATLDDVLVGMRKRSR